MRNMSPGVLVLGVFAVLFGLVGAYGAKNYLQREAPEAKAEPTAEELFSLPLALRDLPEGRTVSAGDITSASIPTALQNMRGTELPERIRPRRKPRKEGETGSAGVTGVGDLLCNFARCCRPVPPEPIVGYITQGRGVSIHRQDCGNFLGLNQRNPERVLEISWGESESAAYPVDLSLHAFDRSGLIRDITAVLADDDANVMDLTSHTDKKSMQVVAELSIEVKDLPTLSAIIGKLEQLPNVVSVRRKA